jgi:hypothetical protein
LLRHVVEVPAVSVVKIEMIEKCFGTQQFMHVFHGWKLYDKKFIFKANSINETEVEEVPILFVDGVIVSKSVLFSLINFFFQLIHQIFRPETNSSNGLFFQINTPLEKSCCTNQKKQL